jgi:hypothetical protein
MKCTHEGRTRQVGEYAGFVGGVSVYPHTAENRAAHGCVTGTFECCLCGARRRENRNGNHVEVSPWGPSKSERAAQARREVERLVSALDALCASASRASKKFVSTDGRTLRVCLDADGFLRVEGARHTSEEAQVVCALALECEDFGPLALSLRESVAALERARGMVLS